MFKYTEGRPETILFKSYCHLTLSIPRTCSGFPATLRNRKSISKGEIINKHLTVKRSLRITYDLVFLFSFVSRVGDQHLLQKTKHKEKSFSAGEKITLK